MPQPRVRPCSPAPPHERVRAATACPRCIALQAHERKWRSDGTAPASWAATASLTTTFTLHQRAARRIPDDMRHPKTRRPSSHSRTRARGPCGSGRRVDRRGSAQRAGRSFGWPCADAAGSRRRCGAMQGRPRHRTESASHALRARVVLGRGGTGRAGAHMSWTGGSSTQSATVASCTASYLTTPQPIDPQPREPLSRWVAHSNKSWPRRRAITRGARVAHACRTRLVARVSHAWRTFARSLMPDRIGWDKIGRWGNGDVRQCSGGHRGRYGLMSRIGVPSIKSIPAERERAALAAHRLGARRHCRQCSAISVWRRA